MPGRIVKSLLILIGPLLTRYMPLLCVLPGLLFAADDTERYRVTLQSADGSRVYPIARLQLDKDGRGYRVLMNDELFNDYFLSMRPFKCMTDNTDMLCHLPYPYALERSIDDRDLTALEHEFLFIRRHPTDYGIDPWNGLYYKLKRTADGFIGQAYEVDLNVLAAPPDGNDLPLTEAEMTEGDADLLWLPRLVIAR